MPWEERTVKMSRESFVEEVNRKERSKSWLCRKYGISRVTGDKKNYNFYSGQQCACTGVTNWLGSAAGYGTVGAKDFSPLQPTRLAGGCLADGNLPPLHGLPIELALQLLSAGRAQHPSARCLKPCCRQASKMVTATALERLRLRLPGRMGRVRRQEGENSSMMACGSPRVSGPKTKTSPGRKETLLYKRSALLLRAKKRRPARVEQHVCQSGWIFIAAYS